MRLLLPLLLIILAAGLFFGVTSGLFVKIDDLRIAQAQAKADEVEALKLKTTYTTLDQQASGVSQINMAKLKLLLPESVDTVDLLVKINGIAKNSAMALSDVKIKTEEAKSSDKDSKIAGLGTATFNFSVTGSYGALRQFLSNLERNLRLVDISTISFSSVEKEPYQYNIELKTYWLK